MSITVKHNEIKINDSELDIYAALEIKEQLDTLLKEGFNNVFLDLSRVSSLSTPAIQVILSASDTFEKFNINKYPLNQSLIEDFRDMGIDI